MLSNSVGGVVDEKTSDCMQLEGSRLQAQVNRPNLIMISEHDGGATTSAWTAGSGRSMDMFISVARWCGITFNSRVNIRW